MESAMAKSKEKKPLCFVIGPIGHPGTDDRRHADMLLNAVIREALQADSFGYIIKRADEDSEPGMINDKIIHDIINAELVVADLTNLNPNAFYELGIRHAAMKPTIHIAKMGTKLPFDNFNYRTIFVDVTDWHDIIACRSKLSEMALAIKQEDFQITNPITQAQARFEMRVSSDSRDQMVSSVEERMAALEEIMENMVSGARNYERIDSKINSKIDYYINKNSKSQEYIWKNPKTHEIRIGKKHFQLEQIEFFIFDILHKNQGRFYTSEEIKNKMSLLPGMVNAEEIESNISHLTDMLSRSGIGRLIVSDGNRYTLIA